LVQALVFFVRAHRFLDGVGGLSDNYKRVNIQSFLHFWSNHNDVIIQVLVALILFIVIYLAFRFFFGPEIAEGGVAAQVNTQDIEKTLQKILEAQAKAPVAMGLGTASESSREPLAGAGASSAATMAELEALKKDLAQKDLLLGQARDAAAKAAAAPVVSAAAVEQVKKLETRIKDLEARLAEYEIISEDIADLSFYKEENIRLQNELANLKNSLVTAGVPVPAAPAASAAAPEVAPTAASPLESASLDPVKPPTPAEPISAKASVAEGVAGSVTNLAAAPNLAQVMPETEPESLDSLLAEAESQLPAANTSAPAPASISVEDDIMKDFAQAVEEQKPPVEPPPAAAKTDEQENSDLMNQFENFVKKS
jgi:DNA repair exonuclease SbcCD ATPase subunit